MLLLLRTDPQFIGHPTCVVVYQLSYLNSIIGAVNLREIPYRRIQHLAFFN